MCHGDVKKNGSFSLLSPEEAYTKAKSEKFTITPYDAENSEVMISHDPKERMPKDKDPLTDE
ncbi:MAG: c-type cytochrome domain-containing protein [Emticicia sp.]|nr:c-type cytochrome domain-containing protein [Emticicia sp.]